MKPNRSKALYRPSFMSYCRCEIGAVRGGERCAVCRKREPHRRARHADLRRLLSRAGEE